MIITQFVPPLAMIWVFSGVAGSKLSFMGKDQIISYYIYSSILYLFLNSQIDEYVKNSIQDGTLAQFLLKPISFFNITLIKDLSARVAKLALGLPAFVILVIIYWQKMNSFSLPALPITLMMVAVSYFLAFLISFTLGLTTFWLEEIWGLQNLKNVSVVLLGGVALPYQIFPEALQKVLFWTPFPYLVNWPIRKAGNLIFEFLSAGLWLIIFFFLAIFLLNKGLKKYNTMGVA